MKLHSIRYSFFWKLIRFFAKPYLSIKFNYKTRKASKISGPFIILSNHVTNLDPFFLQATFPQHLFIVAGEALFRMRIGWFLKFAVGVVSKNRTGTDFSALSKMMYLLHEKKNLCIFPEAKSTYDGQTSQINFTIARLVKKSGAKLITYKIKGGYLSKPIWGKSVRRGKVTGEIVNIYDKEDIAKLTDKELYQKITEDLYENAFETQKLEMIKYKGRNLAQNIDSLYCVCPRCRKENVIKTDGNKVLCRNCGELAVYNEYGFFEPAKSVTLNTENTGDTFFENILEWSKWQKQYFSEEYQKSDLSEVLLESKGFILKEITGNHLEIRIGKGTILLYKNHFDFINENAFSSLLIKDEDLKASRITFMFDGIQKIHILLARNGRDRIEFSDEKGRHFELIRTKIGKENCCFAKILAMFESSKGK